MSNSTPVAAPADAAHRDQPPGSEGLRPGSEGRHADALGDLVEDHPIDTATRIAFREQGFIKLKDVLSPRCLGYYGEVIAEAVASRSHHYRPLSERSTYDKAFLQISNLWRQCDVIREFVFSRKLALMACDLMGVGGVRIYHDQALFKEPSGGHTPWHCDQFYWPLREPATCTVWIPFQPVPLSMGPLAFAVGSHRIDLGRDLEISDESERLIAERLEGGLVDESPFALGEVSFHSGWTFHRASPNRSQAMRSVMTMIYMADDIHMSPPINGSQVTDARVWLPGVSPGEIAACDLTPVIARRG